MTRPRRSATPAPAPAVPAGFAPLPPDFAPAGRHALVVGLGDSGLAMARWLAAEGARVFACDTRAEPPRRAQLEAELPQAEFVGGALEARLLDGVDLVAWSPGLSPFHGPAAALASAARERGIPVVGEIELFARALAAQSVPAKLVAITGTNGKTTTTRLVAHLLAEAGVRVEVAGNVSPPALDALREARARATGADDAPPEVWVLELSSFQLEFAPSLAPDAAAILNVTQDHLDWHGAMDAYGAAKQRIFDRAGTCVWNRDDAATRPLEQVVRKPARRTARAAAAAPAAAALAVVDAVAPAADSAAAPADDDAPLAKMPPPLAPPRRPAPGERVPVSFGLDAPTAVGDFGIVVDGGLAWLAEGIPAEETLRRRRPASAGAVPVRANRLLPADALRIRGTHNHANALAALALARAVGVPMNRLLHALRGYAGEPHRCESIAIVDDVEYVDDSKGTNVGATVAALDGLGRADGPRVLLIAGGDGKGQAFEPLAAPVACHARAVLLIGRDAPRLREALTGTGVELVDCATLDDAVAQAAARARTGDLVLLSPACASLDMFRNYLHRSEVFAAAVHRIAEERGQPC